MPEFTVWFTNTASTSVNVTADSPQEAETLAYDKLPGGLCRACGRERDDGEWIFDIAQDEEGETVLSAESDGAVVNLADVRALADRWSRATVRGALTDEERPDLVTRGFAEQLYAVLPKEA